MPDTDHWDILASKGDIGNVGPQGAQGEAGYLDWQGDWVSQNYIADQAVHFGGSSYVCILDTVTSESPPNATYWNLVAQVGDAGPSGSGTTLNIYSESVPVTGTPFEKVNFIGFENLVQNGTDSTMVDVVLDLGFKHYGASATDPIATPNAGDKYYNTAINHEMFYDASRGKWLSVAIFFEGSGYNGSLAGGAFYRRFNGMDLSTTIGPYVPKGTIVCLSFNNATSGTHTYEILVGGAVVVELPSGGGASAYDGTINVDFDAGVMSSRNKAGSVTTSLSQGTIQYRMRV